MPTYLATGAAYVVSALVLSPAGDGLTGAASTLLIWIRRASDGRFLDFADMTFKASGWTTRQQAMTEADATNAPGLYTYLFNTGAIVSPSANDTYLVELDQVGASTAANVPQREELLMGRHLDTITINLNTTVSSRAVPGDLMGLVAGAITSAKFAADAIDSNALAASAASEVASSVWSTAVPGAFASGSAGFVLGTNLNAAVSSRAAPGDLMGLAGGAITAANFAADAIDSNALAASAASEVAASVWATAEGSGTMGAALALLRRRTTNRRRVDASGVVTFYDDAGLPEATSTLTDVNGGPVVVIPGDPADSTKET